MARTVPTLTRQRPPVRQLDVDPQWYREAVVYEVHVRAFSDSNGDGIGDFPGLTSKLDYLSELGVNALWLLPFYPSPLRDDGYDIADYTDVQPDYGTLRDFRTFLRSAHDRGLRVITELVLNHTSDQHRWFQRARRAPRKSPARNFYVWSDTPKRYPEARIIFKDFEASNWSWDAVAGAYYWHRFYSHQPDLNFDHPPVRKAIVQALDFWLDLGVDGLRLDAVPYLFERDGTSCENLPETHAFLKQLRRHVDEKYGNRMLLAEANQWPEDAASYFGTGPGDEAHTAFHFPLMPRLFMAIRTENRFPILDILNQTPPLPETAQWFVFLRNHDELTLEMVTDEERDYMYRVYADDPRARINLGIRRRLAPLLGNDRRKMELMNGLLFTLIGTPVLYYGDEIGMGDNFFLGDRNGVRTPMQWSPDRNAGFSRANPQRLYLPIVIDPEYHYEAVNVEAQLSNPNSLAWWMRRLIALRRSFPALGHGDLEFLHPDNPKVLAFLRTSGEQRVLVVANLSRQAQHADLDLSAYHGMRPVEVWGRTPFPVIGESPYGIALGAYDQYWFLLAPAAVTNGGAQRERRDIPWHQPQTLAAWPALLGDEGPLEGALKEYVSNRRWFRGKARAIRALTPIDAVPLSKGPPWAHLVIARVDYTEGEPETYALPLALATGAEAPEAERRWPEAIVTRLSDALSEEASVVYDALVDARVSRSVLEMLLKRKRSKGRTGEVESFRAARLGDVLAAEVSALEPRVMGLEQSNTSVAFGDRYMLKLFRGLDEGSNPEQEVGQFLCDQARFRNIPSLFAHMEYRGAGGRSTTVAVLQAFVPNVGDGWVYTLDVLDRYYDRALAQASSPPLAPAGGPLDLAETTPDERVREHIGTYLESARLLGQRTAELHLALASRPEDADFAPQPFTTLFQRSLFQSVRSHALEALEMLGRRFQQLSSEDQQSAERVLDLSHEIVDRFRPLLARPLRAQRIRIHGDYHLGQALFTGKDFVLIDFEGEPARSLSERRLLRSPLRDVAGMVRSFHYASVTALRSKIASGMVAPENTADLEAWRRFWVDWVTAVFLRSYFGALGASPLLPSNRDDLALMLQAYLLDKALYEVRYELNNRPDWVGVPLAGLLEILEGSRARLEAAVTGR